MKTCTARSQRTFAIASTIASGCLSTRHWANNLNSTVDEPNSDIQAGDDRVAEHYANEYFEELARKPFDRQLLDIFAEDIRGAGVVCELGCGPGQVARYLKDRGVDMRGIDLSPQMVRVAGDLNPDIPFSEGDMAALQLPDDSLAAFVLFYCEFTVEENK